MKLDFALFGRNPKLLKRCMSYLRKYDKSTVLFALLAHLYAILGHLFGAFFCYLLVNMTFKNPAKVELMLFERHC